jgi:hypothetical protein
MTMKLYLVELSQFFVAKSFCPTMVLRALKLDITGGDRCHSRSFAIKAVVVGNVEKRTAEVSNRIACISLRSSEALVFQFRS